MNIDQIKQVFTSADKQVTECGIDGYHQVSGSSKHRSLRGLSPTGVLKQARAEGYTRCRWAVRKGGVWTVGGLSV